MTNSETFSESKKWDLPKLGSSMRGVLSCYERVLRLAGSRTEGLDDVIEHVPDMLATKFEYPQLFFQSAVADLTVLPPRRIATISPDRSRGFYIADPRIIIDWTKDKETLWAFRLINLRLADQLSVVSMQDPERVIFPSSIYASSYDERMVDLERRNSFNFGTNT